MTAEAPARLRRLKSRPEFLAAARGQRVGGRAFTVQAASVDNDLPGVGFTVTKKTGNAPERNRIKRRLRAVAETCADQFRPRHDYVLIGRREALSAPFPALVAGLETSLKRAHARPLDRQAAPS